MGLFRRTQNPKGYGELDRRLARKLDKAKSEKEADRIARDEGLEDAEDARKWLRERS